MPNPQFTFTDEEFLQIVNAIYKKELPLNEQFIPITSMDESLAPDRLDSLGMMIFFIWVTDAFGIAEDKFISYSNDDPTYTIKEIQQFVIDNATQAPAWESGSLEQALTEWIS